MWLPNKRKNLHPKQLKKHQLINTTRHTTSIPIITVIGIGVVYSFGVQNGRMIARGNLSGGKNNNL